MLGKDYAEVFRKLETRHADAAKRMESQAILIREQMEKSAIIEAPLTAHPELAIGRLIAPAILIRIRLRCMGQMAAFTGKDTIRETSTYRTLLPVRVPACSAPAPDPIPSTWTGGLPLSRTPRATTTTLPIFRSMAIT